MTILADCKFFTDGSITSGSTSFSSTSSAFTSADIGKTICIAGAGASGGLHNTTISSVAIGVATLTLAASTTVTSAQGQCGTDNTVAVNSAIAAGGTITLPAGNILVSDVNITNMNSVILQGTAPGINYHGVGTVLVQSATTKNIIDLTGSGGIVIKDLQVGTDQSTIIITTGILCAQKSGSLNSTLLKLDNVFVTGSFTAAALYSYGIQDSVVRDSYFWNKLGTSASAIVLSKENVSSVSSSYQTIATGSQPNSNWLFDKFEAHDYKASGGHTSGQAILLRGANNMNFRQGLIDSSSSSGNVVYQTATDGTPCSNIRYENCQPYSENGTLPTYNHYVSGSLVEPSFHNCTVSYGTAAFGGSGSITSTKGIPLIFMMAPGTNNGGTSTTYFGNGVTSSTEFFVRQLYMTRMLVCNLFVEANGNVSSGSHALTLQAAGNDTALACSVSGAPTGGNSTNYAIVNAGQGMTMKDTASGGATLLSWVAGCCGIPF